MIGEQKTSLLGHTLGSNPDLYCRILASHDYLNKNVLSCSVIGYQLQAANILLSLSVYDELKKSNYNQIIEKYDSFVFHNGEKYLLFINNKSSTYWNALYSLLKTKTSNDVKIAETLLTTIQTSKIQTDILFDEEKSTASHGSFVLLALIDAYRVTKDNKFLIGACYCAEVLMNQIIDYDPYLCLGLSILYDFTNDIKYFNRKKSIISSVLKLKTKSMTSLIAGLAQQMLTFTDEEKRRNEIFLRQIECQIYKKTENSGAFIIRPEKNEIRLDYIYENLLGMVQFLTREKYIYCDKILDIE